LESDSVEISKYEKLPRVILEYFDRGEFLKDFTEEYPYPYPCLNCIEFEGPNGEKYGTFEELISSDVNTLPKTVKGSWSVVANDNEIVLSWKAPEWFCADFTWSGEQLFNPQNLIAVMKNSLI